MLAKCLGTLLLTTMTNFAFAHTVTYNCQVFQLAHYWEEQAIMENPAKEFSVYLEDSVSGIFAFNHQEYFISNHIPNTAYNIQVDILINYQSREVATEIEIRANDEKIRIPVGTEDVSLTTALGDIRIDCHLES